MLILEIQRNTRGTGSTPEAWTKNSAGGWKKNSPLHIVTCLYFHRTGASIVNPI